MRNRLYPAPHRHFACVDMAAVSGDVCIYGIDFFLSGDSGAMIVTEAALHKLNGIPFYVWKQNEKGVWQKVPIEGTVPELLGMIRGSDEFKFFCNAKLPEITDRARIWIPLPVLDEFQKAKGIDAPENKSIF